MRRFLVPLIFGVAGAAVLISLGIWQMQRLSWKENVLADIETRILAAPAALPKSPDAGTDRYLPVTVTGTLGPEVLRVLVSQKQIGAGYRLITRLDRGDRQVLVDLGFIRVDRPLPVLPDGPVTIAGNLHWPDDRNSSTPENDLAGNIWFARDLPQMASVLNSEPLLLIARRWSFPDAGVTPLPVDSTGIPNDHLNYAITWFSLAVVWLVMTGFFLWRMSPGGKKGEET